MPLNYSDERVPRLVIIGAFASEKNKRDTDKPEKRMIKRTAVVFVHYHAYMDTKEPK